MACMHSFMPIKCDTHTHQSGFMELIMLNLITSIMIETINSNLWQNKHRWDATWAFYLLKFYCHVNSGVFSLNYEQSYSAIVTDVYSAITMWERDNRNDMQFNEIELRPINHGNKFP